MNEAEVLFTEVLNCDRVSLYLNRRQVLDKHKLSVISSALKRRVAGEPIEYILGKAEFMGLGFRVTPDVLIPRPETEILVEAVIKYVTGSPANSATVIRIMDIGTGSGCIAVSLAKLLGNCSITAVDISHKAIAVAKQNALLNGVTGKIRFINKDFVRLRPQADDLQPLSFDAIVSNPPYISTAEIENLEFEARIQPPVALDGGRDGLRFYRNLVALAPVYLKKRGFLIMEMGFNQKEKIKNIFQKTKKFEIIDIIKDYSGIDRVIVASERRF